MALQFRRYAGAQIFAFDFGGSIRAAALAMGGDWHDLGGALSEDVAEPVALQPLARIDDAAERAWAADWIADLLARESVPITPEFKERLWSALTSPRVRSRFLRGADDHRPVRPRCSQERAEARRCSPIPSPMSLGPPARRRIGASGPSGGPGLRDRGSHRSRARRRPSSPISSIASRIDSTGAPTLADDRCRAELALDDRGFAGQLREWLETLRKKNASVIFATQSLADIDGSPIAPAIVESCPTRVFLPNERALEPQIATIYRRFGLNDRQIEILSLATPKRDYRQSRRGNRLFDLGLSEVALAFAAASSKTDQAAIAETFATHGREGLKPARGFAGKYPAWAADMLTNHDQEIPQ